MKKVALMITKSEFGGGQEYLRILMSGARDTKFVLITGDRGYLTDEAARMNIRVHVCTNLVYPIRPAQDLRAVADVCAVLRSEKPDLLHANSSKAGVVGRLAARLAGIPAVFTAHGWAFTEGVDSRRARIAWLTEKFAAPLAKEIICVSDYDRNLALKKRVGRLPQLLTVHNGIPDLEKPPPVRRNAVPRVVMVARFAPPKDYVSLLEAAACFHAGELQVVCVGDGPDLPQLRQLAERRGVLDRVEFTGARRDVPQILESADVFALISNWEGLPISILEAMRSGLPVVASRVGGVPEAVQHEGTGILVDRNDPGLIAAALRRLIADPALRTRMGKWGRACFLRRFSADRMIRETEEIYARFPAGRHAVPAPALGRSVIERNGSER